MKRILLLMLIGLFTTNAFSLSTSKIRLNARFLSDRMAYELDLTPMQYEYCYEINYDFLYGINRIMDDVVYGYTDAIDMYYDYLDQRNEDLRYVLNSVQYVKFRSSEYFHDPIYSNGITWDFRIYTIYSNKTFFYYDSPSIYKTYDGLHSHKYYATTSYYVNRIDHGTIGIERRIALPDRQSAAFANRRKSDFGVNTRNRNETVRYNNYKNENQRNRTLDNRYLDNSGNKNSPSINSPVARPNDAPARDNRNIEGNKSQTITPNNNNSSNNNTQKETPSRVQRTSGNTGSSSGRASGNTPHRR